MEPATKRGSMSRTAIPGTSRSVVYRRAALRAADALGNKFRTEQPNHPQRETGNGGRPRYACHRPLFDSHEPVVRICILALSPREERAGREPERGGILSSNKESSSPQPSPPSSGREGEDGVQLSASGVRCAQKSSERSVRCSALGGVFICWSSITAVRSLSSVPQSTPSVTFFAGDLFRQSRSELPRP